MAPRLERFREAFSRLDPVTSYERVADMYVSPPGRAASDQLATRLQLSPRSAHLLVGSIGTGKSTQLHRTAALLEETGDTRAIYIDVSVQHDLTTDLTGVLTVLTGLALSRIVEDTNPSVQDAVRRFNQWAEGYSFWVPHDEESDYDDDRDPSDYGPGEVVHKPGILRPPVPPMREVQAERVLALQTLVASLSGNVRHFVVLFDSLDRLQNIDAFLIVAEDIRVLSTAGIGVATVGPTRLLYGAPRTFTEAFDQVIPMSPLDVIFDALAREYMLDVLLRRVDPTIVNLSARTTLVAWSGGFIRDLLELTRAAVEEAFITNSQTVTGAHVTKAADIFGRTLMLGLDADDLRKLQRLRKSGTFVRIDNRDLDLLTSRRIIEYQQPATTHRVHPTLVPLLVALDSP